MSFHSDQLFLLLLQIPQVAERPGLSSFPELQDSSPEEKKANQGEKKVRRHHHHSSEDPAKEEMKEETKHGKVWKKEGFTGRSSNPAGRSAFHFVDKKETEDKDP